MAGIERLDDDLSRNIPPARASRHLGEQLEGPLARAEVGKVKGRIGGYDAHQGNPGKVMSLGDHLGPDQNAAVTGAEAVQDVLVPPLAPGGVAVHALHR